MATDPDEQARHFARQAATADDPAGWFEPLYAAAAGGGQPVPWNRGEPQRLLVEWVAEHEVRGGGRSALVVGCGLGYESEYLAERGFAVTAFDVSPTAIRGTRERFPASPVRYEVANLLRAPQGWRGAFDFVFEAYTVQSLPTTAHRQAIDAVTAMLAPGGSLLVVTLNGELATVEPPPWPLTRAELDSFATGDVRPVRVEDLPASGPNGSPHWRAEFQRSR
jgi:2-polyprenyl-3-methyl-5-hydroxy-6-metoxy-1,4-benzoquinol methylase